MKNTQVSPSLHSKRTSLGIRGAAMADPNTRLRITVSFITMFKAGPEVSFQGISDCVACHNFLVRVRTLGVVWFKVACRNAFLRIVPCTTSVAQRWQVGRLTQERQTTSLHQSTFRPTSCDQGLWINISTILCTFFILPCTNLSIVKPGTITEFNTLSATKEFCPRTEVR